MEIERKFLVRALPDDLDQYPHSELEQGYLASGGTTVRIRRDGDTFLMTVKKKLKDVRPEYAKIGREEIEEEIPEDLYRRLSAYTEDPMLRKTRYRIPFGSHTIELDIYHGVLEGLATAEIEFQSFEEAVHTEIPDWFGTDVSTDKRYKNSHLSKLRSLDELTTVM